MATYNFPRLQIKHGRYWRGAIHSWATTYFLSGSNPDASLWAELDAAIRGCENNALYGAPSDGSGFYAVEGYNTTGGPPAYSNIIGELLVPSTWQPYTSGDWTSDSRDYETVAEVCMDVRWPVAGLSSTGKPVFLRKFYRAVSVSGDLTNGSTPDILGAVITAVQSNLALLSNGGLPDGRLIISENGRLPSSGPTVQPYYGIHQMPRGKKKKVTGGSVLSSLLADAGKASAGGLVTALLDTF